ncbi:hypothetical protein [Desulfotomaculum sp. 1211_IL3151]|uniref:hypothetical protein n=1 Tax=Desulfotomaculum sp. 1211_IL3151 TaxID=3084055 RepID=UPI002FDA7770
MHDGKKFIAISPKMAVGRGLFSRQPAAFSFWASRYSLRGGLLTINKSRGRPLVDPFPSYSTISHAPAGASGGMNNRSHHHFKRL